MSIIYAHKGKARIVPLDAPAGRECAVVVNYTVEEDDIWIGPDESAAGMKSWSGTFRATDIAISLGPAELVLEDGRRGRVFISRIDLIDVTAIGDEWKASTPGGEGSFIGTGPAPE